MGVTLTDQGSLVNWTTVDHTKDICTSLFPLCQLSQSQGRPRCRWQQLPRHTDPRLTICLQDSRASAAWFSTDAPASDTEHADTDSCVWSVTLERQEEEGPSLGRGFFTTGAAVSTCTCPHIPSCSNSCQCTIYFYDHPTPAGREHLLNSLTFYRESETYPITGGGEIRFLLVLGSPLPPLTSTT